MSQKRKRADMMEGDHDVQKLSQKKPFKPGKAHQKSNGKRPHPSQTEPKTTSTSELKSRIRNLRRLLEHVENAPRHKMPAGVRIERERELETCEHDLTAKKAAAHDAERRKKMISKYHHVRFFDRQKATRMLKQLKRQLSTQTEMAQKSGDESKIPELQQQIHEAEVAVNYAIYYPLMKPYSSLYPRSKQENGNSEEPTEGDGAEAEDKNLKSHKGNPELWEAVERAMEEGTLDKLRNSEESVPARRPIENTKKREQKGKHDKKKSRQSQHSTKAARIQDEEDDSDGGFFE